MSAEESKKIVLGFIEDLSHGNLDAVTAAFADDVTWWLPGSLPVVISGWRIGFARAWRVLLAGELLVAPELGLGVRIFDAQEQLNSAIIYGGIILIGIMGFTMERLLLRSIEVATVQKWGMLREL